MYDKESNSNHRLPKNGTLKTRLEGRKQDHGSPRQNRFFFFFESSKVKRFSLVEKRGILWTQMKSFSKRFITVMKCKDALGLKKKKKKKSDKHIGQFPTSLRSPAMM